MLPKPRHSGRPGRPYLDHRTVMNGIFGALCSGAPGRDLPERYGHWKTVYNRFNRWSKLGVINLIFNQLLKFLDEQGQIDWQSISIDGCHIRALKAAAGAKKHPDEQEDHGLGRSRGGFGSKIHLAADGNGLALAFCLSGGQAHESRYAEKLLRNIGIIQKTGHLKCRPNAVLGDKAYSSQSIHNYLKSRGIKAVIPFKSNEKASQDVRGKLNINLYKKRNVVERAFAFFKGASTYCNLLR